MRTFLPLLLAVLLAAPANAQINVGDVPPGTSVLDPGIDLQLTQPFTMVSDLFDVDCDGTPDIRAALFQGNPNIDAPNHCQLELLDSTLTLCADVSQFNWRPNYYTFGQGLVCPSGFNWRNDSVTVLGDIGGFSAIGPWVIDSMYVAYQKGTDLGWILLSFDLGNGGGAQPTYLRIHEVLQQCLANSVAEYAATPALRLYPNPSQSEAINIEASSTLRRIELLDPIGKLIEQFPGSSRSIPSPTEAGVYLIRAVQLDGQTSVVRFVQY